MVRMVIDDVLWRKLKALLPTRATGGRPPKDNRLFIEAVCWVIRTGAPWRDLPPDMVRGKQFRRVATRYDKLAITFMGAILIASILIWLKG